MVQVSPFFHEVFQICASVSVFLSAHKNAERKTETKKQSSAASFLN
jgi:hypothetical protein